ncbi:hypothetical protein SAMN05192574_105195 [Mucilaginibacter gossypiicola]|uniref:Uncharacterized protein n=1 Tax=Mucilaginibacter gossypiicola TaxID=551995 RepID=A0A1H8LPU1_9SPHI|nr:hypothetical protein [Mucilaginibacter gossypiicola]SEO07137.1 hypothetical protein SAMN05192574_105195 [Mucilaginibacter gossypiicola]
MLSQWFKVNANFIAFFFGLSCCVIPSTSSPKHTISNGMIVADLYLVDPENGYYCGTRFDWAGVFSGLRYKGHTFFGQWSTAYAATNNDAVIGPVESFSPIGYNDAKQGKTFVVIGVGVLRKKSDTPYKPKELYKIVDGGIWTVRRGKNAIVYQHTLHDASGYAYLYTKTVSLIRGEPKMVLKHSLKNIGKRPIVTDVFDHNFPVIDNQPTGPAIKIKFRGNVKATGKWWGTNAVIHGNTLSFLKVLQGNEWLQCDSLTGFGNDALDYDFKMENHQTGAGIRATSDQPLKKVVFWACATTACPEPYIKITVAPGQTLNWTITYEFYTFTPDAN